MLFKKIASVFLTIALIVTASSVVLADDAVGTEIFKVEAEAVTTASTLSVSPILYTPGEKITVRFSAAQNTGITSLKFTVKYDNGLLKYIDCKPLNLFNAKQEYFKLIEGKKENYLQFYSENYPNVSDKTGVFAEVTFEVKDNVCADNVNFETELFKGQKGNCTVMGRTGSHPVPFEASSNTFSVHKISAENATVTAPTCTEQGYTTYKCATCGKDIKGNITNALGHTPAEAVEENRVEPTCTENGTYDSVVYCKVCNAELSREKKTIDPLGHKYGEATVIEPTYKAGGYSIHKCEVCGYEEKFDIKPALEYTPGDVNNDGVIDSTDALLVLRANSGLAEITPLMEVAGDLNGDGIIDSTDALLILRINSGLKTETKSDNKITAY